MHSENGEWLEKLQKIKVNDPHMRWLSVKGNDIFGTRNMTLEKWEELGRDIAANTHLTNLDLYDGGLNDHKLSCLCLGLTRSSSIKTMFLMASRISAAGVRSMVPFLQNANSLTELNLCGNNIQSEGFNLLFWALRDSSIEKLNLSGCSIESIEINSEHIPRNLTSLDLLGNNINSEGCREIAKKLLKGGNATLQTLSLESNGIDDEGVEIIVDALKNNTSLTTISLMNNEISVEGFKSCLRLVNDISSIEATLKSNHTLRKVLVHNVGRMNAAVVRIDSKIYNAVRINKEFQNDPYRVGKEKIIKTQLNNGKRNELADIQGVSHSLYSEIDPLHLPEVLALVCRRHGQRELYVALKSSIAGVISTVNRRECIKQQRDYYLAKAKQLDAELAAMDAAEQKVVGIESRSSKRRRQ